MQAEPREPPHRPRPRSGQGQKGQPHKVLKNSRGPQNICAHLRPGPYRNCLLDRHGKGSCESHNAKVEPETFDRFLKTCDFYKSPIFIDFHRGGGIGWRPFLIKKDFINFHYFSLIGRPRRPARLARPASQPARPTRWASQAGWPAGWAIQLARPARPTSQPACGKS